MRRLSLLGVAALLTLLLALPAAAVDTPGDAPDAPGASSAGEALVLAAEAGEPLGPDPQPRDAEGNRATELAGYEDREVQFTWGAAWILSVAGLLGVGLLALIFRFRVARS